MSEMRKIDDAAPLGDPEFDLADRMRKALRQSDVSVQAMAKKLGKSRNTISTWINGSHVPDDSNLREFAGHTGLRYEWLKYGISAGGGNNDGIPALGERRHRASYGWRQRRVRRPHIVPPPCVSGVLHPIAA